jgi:hypothetical protein
LPLVLKHRVQQIHRMGLNVLAEIQSIFRKHGVSTIYVKTLAEKQDNEKNQIFLGREVTELLSVFPGKLEIRQPSESELKRQSEPGRPITEATLNFYWLDRSGNSFHAPQTRLIDYFQYPEARLSGFLQGCKWAPDAIRRRKQAEYGTRVLFLGANRSGNVFGLLLTEREDPLVEHLPEFPESGASSVLKTFSADSDTLETSAHLLELRLREIIGAGWHASVINRGGQIEPFKGNQGAGYTLEALLGVQANAEKEPDILGHELKTFRSGKLSLMTPTADGGPEGELSFREFMDRFGAPGKSGDGSIRFTGVARVSKPNASTGRQLRLTGYDHATGRFSPDPDDVRIEQFNAGSEEVLSVWTLRRLADGWNKKHAQAAYIEAAAASDGSNQYRYLMPFFLCSGTDIWRFLRAVAEDVVYYDPAHSIYATGEAKVRPQWRISTADFANKLSRLYTNVRTVSEMQQSRL